MHELCWIDSGDGVGWRQSSRFGLTLKAGKPIVVSGERQRQDLDGDLPLQFGIGGPIDLAHSAGADGGYDFVRAESCAWSQGQGVPDYRSGYREPTRLVGTAGFFRPALTSARAAAIPGG